MSWQFVLTELDGQGGERLITPDLKLANPQVTRVLSGPHQITGSIAVPDSSLLVSNELQFKRWKTALYAQPSEDQIFAGGLLADFTIDGPSLDLDFSGFTTYAKDQPYDADYQGVGVDPLDVVRDIWGHIQNAPGGHLGLQLDELKTGLLVGTPPENVEFTTGEGENVSFTAGPIKLNWWSTEDAGGKVDTFAKETPFDYLEEHWWEGEHVYHKLRFGYPSLGGVRDRLRFVLGENVYKAPQEAYESDEVVTEVWVLGAGEGRTRIRGVAAVAPSNSLRRVKIVNDKSITSKVEAQRVASDTLARYQPAAPGAGITELYIANHGNAPLGSYDVGDFIPYIGDHDWGTVDLWVKILKLTVRPEEGDFVIATVAKADTLG